VLSLITHRLLPKKPKLARTVDVLYFELIMRPARRGQQRVDQLLPRHTLVEGHAYRLHDRPNPSDHTDHMAPIRLRVSDSVTTQSSLRQCGVLGMRQRQLDALLLSEGP